MFYAYFVRFPFLLQPQKAFLQKRDNLLHNLIQNYAIDESRIYGTDQSQGCMTNIALSDKHPDLFAAQFLVAGQWNVEEMAAMKDKTFGFWSVSGTRKLTQE